MSLKRHMTILCCLLIGSISPVLAQSKQYNKEQKKAYLEGDSYFVYGDYASALTYLEPLAKVDKEYSPLFEELSVSYYHLRENEKALHYFGLTKERSNSGQILYAKALLKEAQLEECLKQIQVLDDKNLEFELEEEARSIKAQVALAKAYMAYPEELKIYNLGDQINTANDEYVPLIDADESRLVFTSKRKDSDESMSPSGLAFEKVYYSNKDENGNWTKAEEIQGEVNANLNTAGVALSGDGEKLIVFKTDPDDWSVGNLFESEEIDGAWTKPKLLNQNINSPGYIETGASISLDGNTIYFSSNRPGGLGGFDLYRVKKLPNGNWSQAMNLGPNINTKKNDKAPFIHPNGFSLFFSSEGHENMGGYDIFRVELNNDSLVYPVNLAFPTNTTQDDFHYVITANERYAYYSSEREDSRGGQDIYKIDYINRMIKNAVLRSKVLDEATGLPLAAEIQLLDNETGDLVGSFSTQENKGKFIFLVEADKSYEIEVMCDNYELLIEEIQFEAEDLLNPEFQLFKLKKEGRE